MFLKYATNRLFFIVFCKNDVVRMKELTTFAQRFGTKNVNAMQSFF